MEVRLLWIDARIENDLELSQWMDLRYRVLREPLGLTYSEEDLIQESEDLHLVALEGQRVIAGLLIRNAGQEVGVWKIRQVAVEPSRQGEGLGRTLMLAVERAAQESSVTSLVLHSREGVCGFYEKLGYRSVGGTFTEVGIPHRRMERSLADSPPCQTP